MNDAASDEFRIDGDLPSGLTVLEASAGTGKTYSLAGLVTRFVAEEGVEAAQICVVSFTEAATAELRGRIRDKLALALHHLVSGEKSDDDVVGHLQADPERCSTFRARLEGALADFDAATISTIHGFCSRVVATGAGTGVDVAFTNDDSDIDEVVNDRFLERFGTTGDCPTTPAKVAEAVRLRLRIPDATLFVPDRSQMNRAGQTERADRIDQVIELVDEVVAEVRARRAALRRRTFDSLLVEARDLLRGPWGEATRALLQQRFRVVMIDEFQDTDRVQWDIFRLAFLEGPAPATVVVVGDPKQSIYRFRSAELSAYLDARARADAVTSLGKNWRSDAPLLAALERLFEGFTFGDDDVRFQPVTAADPDADEALLDPSPCAAPLQLRAIGPELTAADANAAARRDVVAEVVRLLGEATIADARAPGGRRPLAASDIGVLVRSNADATAVVASLSAAGVPAASSSNDSVLDSAAAGQWRMLLSALERPSSAPRARAAALTWFGGMTPAELVALDALDDDGPDGFGGLVERLRGWAACVAGGGLAALMAEMRAGGLLERVLARPGGERDLTDLDHVLELLQGVVGGRPAAASALLAALDALTDPDLTDEDAIAPELLARRIDRDDDTVKVLTVHRAKGLEFPVVLCPTLWRQRPNLVGLPHAQLGAGRVIDTNCLLPSKSTAKAFVPVQAADKEERFGEDRRLLYVALTRARHRLVVWWSENPKVANAPLGELLTHAGGGTLDPVALAKASDGTIGALAAEVPERPPVLTRAAGDDEPLSVCTAERHLDRTWYQWSFSSIKGRIDALAEAAADATASAATAERPAVGGVDEQAEVVPPLDVLGAPAPGTPLQSAPAGTGFGTLVHSVMERVDFAAADVADQLRERSAELLHYRRLPVTPDALAEGLLVALATPLGGCMGQHSLRDLERRHRLDELAFDLPLGRLDARTIAGVVARHLPAVDPLRAWFDDAARPGAEPVDVAGLLTGSIDLVARTPDGRYWLADYKTNLLPDGDYRPAALAVAMAHHGYPLQATLYLVALHRYLRWRLRGYRPDEHLAGAAYLFLRGMDPAAGGPDAPGIVWWRPPTAAIEELDRLLATGTAA